MASGIYDNGLLGLVNRSIDYVGGTIKVLLVDGTYTFSRADSFATVAAKELGAVTGYAPGFSGAGRKTLGSKAIVLDATNHRVKYTAANQTWTAVATGQTIGGAAIYYLPAGASDDSGAIPLAWQDPSDVSTNGGDVSLTFDATNGVAFFQN